VIGGGMERAGDILMDAIRASLRRFAYEEPATAVKVIPSLLGDDANVLGVSALAAREVFIHA